MSIHAESKRSAGHGVTPAPAAPVVHAGTSEGAVRASELIERERGRVCGFADECFAHKFMCMGVVPGSRVRLVRKAAFGRACYFDIDGRKLAVRREEAACLLLHRIAEAL